MGWRVAVVLLATSCAATGGALRAATAATYCMRHDMLWAEVREVMRARYPSVEIAELQERRLTTSWIATGFRFREAVPFQSTTPRIQDLEPLLLRFVVTLSEGTAYRVQVKAQTAIWSDAKRAAVPFVLTESLDPAWAAGPRGELAVAIHERLRALAGGEDACITASTALRMEGVHVAEARDLRHLVQRLHASLAKHQFSQVGSQPAAFGR